MVRASGDYQYARQLLRQALGSPAADFREGQWEAIEQLVHWRARLLVVQRTGWGKSLVYFLATRLLRDRGAGPTLLISPLLALMRNQLLAADRLGISAATINSSNRTDWAQIAERLAAGTVDILLVSPERLANDDFRTRELPSIVSRIGLFVVDEAHCISDWGHDFRPDYRRIARILQVLPASVPVLATTATANDRVVQDVTAQLGSSIQVSRGPLARASLCLQNIHLPSQAARLAWLAEHLPRLPGSGTVYTLTVADAQAVAGWLQEVGIAAHAYWGDQPSVERERLEQALLANEVKALVATSALGMGFDKPDLGFVVHFQRPGSVVHYYQQVGRAGRALDQAYGILLSGDEDEEIADYFIRTAFPPEAHVDEVLSALNGAEDGLTRTGLEARLNLSRGQIEKVLKILAVESPSPVTRQDNRWYATPITYLPDRDRIDQLTRIRRHEQQRMHTYLGWHECLMAFLRRELDDPDPTPCGHCAACVGAPVLPTTFDTNLASRAAQFLRRTDYVIEPRKLCPEDALAPLGLHGRIPPALQAQPGRALSLWGDAGWGDLVKRGKQQDAYYHDSLVEGAAQMIWDRWRPDPFPTWVTCIPSQRHPDLVPSFARRLAQRLGLHFEPCLLAQGTSHRQKDMANSYQQARNVAPAFAAHSWPGQGGPVLLVDDMVDSGWTFAVVSALLRQAGSGPVFPLALAKVLGIRDG